MWPPQTKRILETLENYVGAHIYGRVLALAYKNQKPATQTGILCLKIGMRVNRISVS